MINKGVSDCKMPFGGKYFMLQENPKVLLLNFLIGNSNTPQSCLLFAKVASIFCLFESAFQNDRAESIPFWAGVF